MTRIIAIEGIDGTGKTVQLENLRTRLVEQGFAVKQLSFPQYDSFIGTEIGRFLTNKDGVSAADVDAKSMALWFAVDRAMAFRNFDYSDADILLINRYVLSNAVYQSIRERDLDKPDLLDFVLELEHRQFGLPVPDLYLVLDMEPVEAAGNVERKGFRDYVGDEQKDVYEATDGIQARARAKYKAYAERLDTIRIINCMDETGLMPIDAVARRINQEVDTLLKG